jgi:hypothetical protein
LKDPLWLPCAEVIGNGRKLFQYRPGGDDDAFGQAVAKEMDKMNELILC